MGHSQPESLVALESLQHGLSPRQSRCWSATGHGELSPVGHHGLLAWLRRGRGPGRDGEQGSGRRGGRGGYGDMAMRPDRRGSVAAAAQASPEPEGPKLPHSLKVAQRLFTGDATLATEEPV